MAYLLILPICLYTVLAVLVLSRHPRTVSNVLVAAYTLVAVLVTAGYLILGTTSHRTLAEAAAVVVTFGGAFGYVLLAPLVLISLYFEKWLHKVQRPLLVIGTLSALLALVAFSALRPHDVPFVYRLTGGAWINWALGVMAMHWPVGLVLIFASQMVIVAVVMVAVYHGVMRLRPAVQLTLISLVSVLIWMLSPLAGAHALVTVAALNYVPPVVLIFALFARTSRKIPLDTLISTTKHTYNDGMFVLDGQRRVIWHNAQTARWIASRETNPLAQPFILDLLRGSPLQETVRQLLDAGQMRGECEVTRDGEEFILRAELQALTNLRDLPGGVLLVLRDITTARVRRDLHERSRELLALSAISADIASSLEVDHVIERALQQIATLTEAGLAMVYMQDEHDPAMIHLAGKRLAATNQIRFPPEHMPIDFSNQASPTTYALRTRQSLFISVDDPIYRESLKEIGVQAGAFVPLMAHERVTGILMVAHAVDHRFSPIEQTLLESIARQLAVAIDNARLHEQERRQRQIAEVLLKTASTLGRMPRDEALRVMLDLLGEIIAYDRATVMLVTKPGTLRVGAYAGFADEPDDDVQQKHIEIESFAYLKRLFDTRTPQLVSDTTTDAGWTPGGQHPPGSWVGAPLVVHDQVLGCLSISHNQPGRFDQDDLRTVSAFAAQAAVTAQSALLFETEQRRRVQAELMQQATYDLVTSPDLESALTGALHNLAKVLSFDRANIGLISEDHQSWVYRAGLPQVARRVSSTPIPIADYPSIQKVIEHKQPVMILDTRQSTIWLPGRFSPQEVRCWLGVPLVARERVIGILNIDSFEPYSFTEEEHVQITRVFANQIAAALENFRLFSEASRQNRALSALNTVLAASNEALVHEDLSLVLLQRVLDALGLAEGAIHHYDSFAKELRLRASAGLPEALDKALARVPVETSLAEVVLPEADGSRETFSAPLISHGVEIGLLSIFQQAGTPLSGDLKHLLVTIGQQVGVVMDNAALFEEANRRASLSTDLGRLSLAIGAQLDRDAVLDLLCRESVGIFNVQGAYIWLIERDRLVGKVAYGPGAEQFVGQTIALDDVAMLPARVIQEWRPHYVNQIADSPALPPELMDLTQAQSLLVVPLLKAHIPIGTLMLVNTETPGGFAGWLADQVGLLGVQAALAIQNATLFEEVRRRLDQLRLVNETGRYATAILNPQDLIDGVARKLSLTLHYNIVSLVQAEQGELVIQSIFVQNQVRAVDEEVALHQPLIDIASRAIERAEPVLGDQLCNAALISAEDGAFGHCALAVPLIIADEVSGVLIVARQGGGNITEEDLDVLEPLAAQLAISFQNARLFETVRQQALELELRVAQRTEEIRQQQERTEAILRSVADAVIVFDLQGRVIMTNPMARLLYDEHDLDMDLGMRVEELVNRALNEAHDVSAATDIIEVGQVTVQAKAARVVEGNEVLGSVVVLRDISRLQELDRMKDQFVSNVSHELRTPLANIKLYLSLLEQGRPDRRANYYEVMEREIQRLTRLINDLLQISRLASEQRDERPHIRQPVDLEVLIDTVIQDNMAWAESERKELAHECLSPSLPRTFGDPDQIVRALTNLIGNAISYTPDGGCITVRSWVSPAEQTKPEWVIIEVRDTGIGIPAEELSSIFDRFYRGSNVGPNVPGTGLGLAIIRDIVRLHGGSIEVESEEGQGSTFRLKFPVLES
jgi:GAF domain-containing protein